MSRPPRVAAAAAPFRTRTAVLLALVGAAGLGALILFLVFGPRAAGGDAYAASLRRSALGYRALNELIEAEVPVRAGRGFYPAGLSPRAPLLVLDPRPSQAVRLARTVERATAAGVPVVLVLPKWGSSAGSLRRGWVAGRALRPEHAVLLPLHVALDPEDADDDWTERPGDAGEAGERVGLVRPPRLDGEFETSLYAAQGLVPELPEPQLLVDPGGRLLPLVANRQGILVARHPGWPLYVVSDPDLLNVSGLGRGDNAVLAHRLLVDELQPLRWVVMVGNYGALPPVDSLWAALLRPPLSTVTLHLALLAALAGWAASGRFGRAGRLPPRVAPGKRTLVDNTARLLAAAGDPADALDRYLRLTVERAADRLGLPPTGDAAERLRRLDRIGRRRGAGRSLAGLATLAAELPAARPARQRHAVELATALHRWFEEVCDGSVRDR